MNSLNNIAFALIASAGLIALAIDGDPTISRTVIVTLIAGGSFLCLILQSLKPKARVIALDRVASMPLPKWLSPLRWFLSIILISLGFSLLSFLGQIYPGTSVVLSGLLSFSGLFIGLFFLYLLIFGSIRYFVRSSSRRKREEAEIEEEPNPEDEVDAYV